MCNSASAINQLNEFTSFIVHIVIFDSVKIDMIKVRLAR